MLGTPSDCAKGATERQTAVAIRSVRETINGASARFETVQATRRARPWRARISSMVKGSSWRATVVDARCDSAR